METSRAYTYISVGSLYASLWEAELMETDCNVYCSRFLYVGNIAKPRHCFTDPRLLARFHLSLFGEI